MISGLYFIALACQASSSTSVSKTGSQQASPKQASSSTSVSKAGSKQASPEIIPVRSDGTVFADTQLMGTQFSINVWLADPKTAPQAGQAIKEAFYEVARLESLLSEWRFDSAVSLLNQNTEQKPVSIPVELVQVLKHSEAISLATDGAFDITVYSVGQLWSFEPGATPPSAEQIQNVLGAVGWKHVQFDEQKKTAYLQSGAKIGLGAIAKGYAVDAASNILKRRGFKHHIIDGGGDTYVSGKKGQQNWQVGIKNPNVKQARKQSELPGTIATLPITDSAVVTSGTYERYFEYEGKQYAHILNPRTGKPILAKHSPVSVTAVAPNATDADGYCTALTVMGSEKAMIFVESRPDLEAVIVQRSGKILISSGLENRLHVVPSMR